MSESQPTRPSSPTVQLTIHEQRLGQIQINGIYYDVKVIGGQDLGSIGDAFNQTMSKICAIAQTVLKDQRDITRVDINASNATLYKEKSTSSSEFDMSQTIDLTNLGNSSFRASTEGFTPAENRSQLIQATETCSAVFQSIFASGSSSSSSSSSGLSSSSSSSGTG